MMKEAKRSQIVLRIVGAALLLLAVMSLPAFAQGTMFVKGDRVSIGNSTPDAPLMVDAAGSTVGTGNSVILLRNPGALAFQVDDTNNAGFWNFAAAVSETEFRIAKSGMGVFKFNQNGNLTIPGDIYTSSCAPCTSDYVFEDGYELMPLDQVESFIEANGHLPNTLSEAQLKERGGVALHEMTTKLMEKVEELTLYTIQQQKLIDQLLAEREAAAAAP